MKSHWNFLGRCGGWGRGKKKTEIYGGMGGSCLAFFQEGTKIPKGWRVKIKKKETYIPVRGMDLFWNQTLILPVLPYTHAHN